MRRVPRIDIVSGASDFSCSSSHSVATASKVSASVLRSALRLAFGSMPSANSRRASSRLPRALECHIGIGAEGKELLPLSHVIAKPPKAAAARSYKEKQTALVKKLIGLLRRLGSVNFRGLYQR